MTSSIWGLAKTNPQPVADSAVEFPTKTRFHIALNVKKVEPLIPFYEVLFGVAPHTVREGYCKFDLREPPLNFSLNEVPKNAKGNGHFGIEVKDTQAIDRMVARLQTSTYLWAHTTAQQPSLQVIDPEGNVWRIFGTKPAAPEGPTNLH
jgi:catechol-2,3-dioxygenase